MSKLKILFHSNSSAAYTGFGRYTKTVLRYLYKTGKYEIVEYATGLNWSHPECQKTPWKKRGVLPDSQQEWNAVNNGDETYKRAVGYGDYYIDRIIKEEKPDIYWGAEDFWAFEQYMSKKWWNKINCVIHTTADSLPIYPPLAIKAKDIKNLFLWTSFATKDLHKNYGHIHAETLHAPFDSSEFHRLSDEERNKLREQFNIPKDEFIISFVSRNQLRKLFHTLIETYAWFKKNKPTTKIRLLFHTSMSEGWDLKRYCKEYGVDISDIYFSYICKNCGKLEVKRYQGEDLNCRFCGAEKSQITCNTQNGVTEEQLNQVYNLTDLYCHMANSGALEQAIVEAMFAECPVCVMPYAYGEEFVQHDSWVQSVDFTLSREFGTQFLKATPKIPDLIKSWEKFIKMSEIKRREIGAKSRDWAIKNFSIESVMPQYEAILDKMGKSSWNFAFDEAEKQPNAVIPDIPSDREWLIALYKGILLMDEGPNSEGVTYWMRELESKRARREDVKNFFIQTALKENEKNKKQDFSSILDNTGNKRALMVIKESLGDCFIITSLFKSFKEMYPDYDLYIACEPKYFDIFDGNQYVHKVIPYHPMMEQELAMIGIMDNQKYFDVYYNAAIGTQKLLNYLSNDRIAFPINYVNKLSTTDKTKNEIN